MKKRLISMLLVAVLAVSLLAGYSLSANAETVSYSTMTYQMKSGDYVLRICQRLGLNYYTCKTAIMKLNNITDNQWNKLAVGRILTLPATDADAIVIATGHGSTINSNTSSKTSSTSTASSSTAAATPKATTTRTQSAIDTAISKDICWWYMVPYTLAAGETVTDACNALGISYSRWQDTIKRDNNISNWNSIPAGTTLWLPTVSEPAKGTQCYTVYRHIMQSGETVYGVVTDRGLDYNALKPMLQTINDGRNLASYKAGEPFYYPVATTINLPSDTTSNNKTITTNSDGTTTIVQTYKLTSGIDTAAAVVEFYVNGNQVREAKAGDTVNVSITTKAGRAAKNVRVKFANGQADLLLTSFSFTMPSCDIRIDADVSKGHKIELVSNYIGKVVTMVDGVSMNAAATGAAVTVASNDPALAIDEVYVSYMTTNGLKREALTNIDNGFVMPDADVTIEATLKAVPTYAIYSIDPPAGQDRGSFSLQVSGGGVVTRAARGTEVTIVPKPDDGYTVLGINVVRRDNNNPVGVFNNTFIMPPSDVNVQVSFTAKGNNIRINPVEGGEFWATTGGVNVKAAAVDEAGTNTMVFLNWQAENPGNGYQASTNPNDYVVTRNDNGLRVNVTIDGTGTWFRMPAGGATVTGGVQRTARNYTARVFLDNNPIPAGAFRGVSLYTKGDNAAQRTEYQDGTGTSVDGLNNIATSVGEYINLSYNGGTNITLVRYEVWNAAETAQVVGLGDQIRMSGSFQMPNQDVVIYAYFASGTVKLAAADVKVTGSGTVGMLDQNNNSVDGVAVGQPFTLSLSPSKGYFFDTAPADGKARLLVTRKAGGGELIPAAAPVVNPNTGEVQYSFAEMPAEGVKVEVVFDKIQYQLQLAAEDEAGNPLNGGGFWKITINKKDTIVENMTSTANVNYGDSVVISLTEAGASQFSIVKTNINGVVSTKTSFTISGSNAINTVIPVTVVLRQKDTNWSNLTKSVNYAARGSMDFVITASTYGYSAPNLNAYVSKAYTGDTVAIIPRAVTPAMYDTDETHIRVNLVGGGYITPTPQFLTVGGQNVKAYLFDVPKEKISSVRVDFIPVEYNLNVDADSSSPATYPATTAVEKSLFQVSYSDGVTNSDVLLSTSFKDVPYNSTVKITLTAAATAQNPKVTFDTDAGNHVGLPTGTTVTATAITFKMPAANTNIGIHMLNAPAPAVTPVPYAPPATAVDANANTLKIKFSTDADGANVVSQITPGESYYVNFDDPIPAGLEPLTIEFYDATSALIDAIAPGTQYEVPNSPQIASAKWTNKPKEFYLKLALTNQAADLTSITIDGTSYQFENPNATYGPVKYGATVTITTDGSRNINSVDLLPGASITGKTASGALQSNAADGATVVATVDFVLPTWPLVAQDTNGNTVNYWLDSTLKTPATSPVDDGTDVWITVSGAGATQYVKSIEVSYQNSPKETIKQGGKVTVKDEITQVQPEIVAKEVSLSIKYQFTDAYDPSTASYSAKNGTNPFNNGDVVKDGDVIAITVTGGKVTSITGTGVKAPNYSPPATFTVDLSTITDLTQPINVTVELDEP